MKVTINVSTPIYDKSKGTVTIKLITATGNAEVSISIEELLPFLNLAPTDAVDFFIISASVYGIDRFVERRLNSIDGWSRELEIKFPVENINKWKSVKKETEELLSFLTGDYWEVNFYKSIFLYPQIQLDNEFNANFSQVNLFSGGLDSLIGAIDFLHTKPKEKILLASHYDSQMHGPKSDQTGLIKKLKDSFGNQISFIPSVEVFLKKTTLPKETTFRSRSILFIGIALLAAKPKNMPIVIPENGTVSLNFPLSSSRRSACSTRTTHPTFIAMVMNLWKKINIETKIFNPYEFLTKGEMVAKYKDDKLLLEIVNLSNSCGKRGHRAHWDIPNASHCGICMPCVYRRASLVSIHDITTYGNNINLLPPFVRQKGQDVGACLEFLKAEFNNDDIKLELIINGLKNLHKIDQYVDVVVRTRKELQHWISKIGSEIVKGKAGIND